MELKSQDGYFFYEKNGTLEEMILTGNNLYRELDELKARGLHSVSLNRYFCQDRIKNLDFLKDYPFITKVCIVDNDFDCNGLYYLNDLTELQIETKQRINYSCFRHLKTLITNQNGGLMFPESLTTLHLWDQKLKEKDLTGIAFPSLLSHLEINKSNILSLEGLPGSLESLSISYCRNFSDISGIERTATRLRYLEINHCPHLGDVSRIKECENLSKLLILDSGSISDLNFLSALRQLEHFSFYGTDVKSADLSNLFSIPYVYFKNSPHYTHKMSDFKK